MNRRTILALTTIALSFSSASDIARADELKFKTVMHAASVQSQDIPDKAGSPDIAG
jgi:hypothetical protein